jgi:DNA-binding NarL/FixJ family response regulator
MCGKRTAIVTFYDNGPQKASVPRTRILVVDDHEIARRNIGRILSDISQLDVICAAASGKEAAVKAEQHLPDLVILNIIFPGFSEIEAARRIREVEIRMRLNYGALLKEFLVIGVT